MIYRISSLLGETTLFFITISIFSILSLSLFYPMLNNTRVDVLSNYENGYKYGYYVTYLFTESNYIYLYNDGRPISDITSVYIGNQSIIPSIQVLHNNSWLNTTHIPTDSIFRFYYGDIPQSIDLVIEGKYVIHIEVVI